MAPRLAVLGATITVLLTHTPAAQGSTRRGDRSNVLVQRGQEKGKADEKSSAQSKLQQLHDKKMAELRAKYRKAALAGKKGSAKTNPGAPAAGKPAPKRAVSRRLSVPELAKQFKTDRPIIARYLIGAADINGDGQLSESERDWVTLEMAKRQKRRQAAGPQQAAESREQRARELRRLVEARKEALEESRTGKRKSKVKVLPKPRVTKRRNVWDTWTRSAGKSKR